MEKYKEIFELRNELEKRNIPFQFKQRDDGWQIFIKHIDNCICDVIQAQYSYGLEFMDDTPANKDVEVKGYLNVAKAVELIEEVIERQ